jgi:nicotinate-nucleotide pyrophosphorylase
MKFFSGEPVELVLTPSNFEIQNAVQSARQLMAQKIDRWILDQLTVEQLKRAVEQMQEELKQRGE